MVASRRGIACALEDDEVVYAVTLDANRRAQTAEAAADDRDAKVRHSWGHGYSFILRIAVTNARRPASGS